jgi:amidase
VLELDIATLRERLAAGDVTAADLAREALARIAALDEDGPRLGAVPVVSPALLDDAAALDAAALDEAAAAAAAVATGPAPAARGPLHGIPFTVKDSFAATGLTLAAGSPAFAELVARRDAVVVERLRAAGALLVGKTNMPPMAIGGGQGGLYGRTRSPYAPEWLAAAWHSGSSIGSGVSVAAEFCVFGIGEETVSSGRSPASNNALVAYTPSWGVVPSTGNWPLHPYRDVVVPHTRSVADLREVLAVIAGPHERDVWSRQDAVDVSAATAVAAAFRTRAAADGDALAGLTVGVPLLYVPETSGTPATPAAIPLRPSIRTLWDGVEAALTAAGAHVVRVPFPLVEAYEHRGDRPTLEEQRLLDPSWTAFELRELMTASWQAFLDEHAQTPWSLHDVDPSTIRPAGTDGTAGGPSHPGRDSFDFARIVADEPLSPEAVAAVAGPALGGLDRARRELFERWLADEGIDVLAFPANSDVGRFDTDENPASAAAAWADGAVFSTTNHVLRRVGIPSVTVPMGVMADTGLPVGATICGPAWTDAHLVDVAAGLEARLAPRARPRLPDVVTSRSTGPHHETDHRTTDPRSTDPRTTVRSTP